MASRTLVRCGSLFDGDSPELRRNQTLVIDDGKIVDIAPSAEVLDSADDVVYDWSQEFVMPGLIDVHTHLSYGNARSEEDIDLYASMEFRTLRGMFFAHQVAAAGYTSMCAPGGAGMLSSGIRDAVDAGLFEGPSITAAGPYITSRQGLTDWYPTWIGVPTTSIGRLVRSQDEAIEEIRRQVKDDVDAVKIALDGTLRRPNGEYVAAFTQQETTAMVNEIHRLGKLAIAHCRGREATLYAGRAGVDLIFHASYMDDEALDAVVKGGCAISPSLTFLRNTIDFGSEHRKTDGYRAEYEAACESLQKARKAGVRMPTGTDTGFAVTPFGEWHARELEIYTRDLGFEPIEALRAATSVSATVLRPADQRSVGRLAVGYRADVVGLKEDPTRSVSVLLDGSKFVGVLRAGKPVSAPRRDYEPKKVTDFSMRMFDKLYTRESVACARQIASNTKTCN